MKTFTTIKQTIKANSTSFAIKAGAPMLFVLSLVIVYQLVSHGQLALGAYMLISQLLEKIHHGGKEAAEHVVHITSHGPKTH